MGCTRPARWKARAFLSEHLSLSVWMKIVANWRIENWSKVTSKSISLSEHFVRLVEDCRQLKKASGSLGQTCLFRTTTRLISRKEQELAKCIDMVSIPIIIVLHINIIILVRSYTMPKRSMRAWRHTGKNQRVKLKTISWWSPKNHNLMHDRNWE